MRLIQSVKGIHDILPEQEIRLSTIEHAAQQVLQSFAYQKIRLPILEKSELFRRSIGDATDIVEKEMYSFADVNDEWLSLRPEGTASCVRSCLQHGLIGKGQTQRLWYQGPFFRRERPQKGRYRQFYQVGVEAFGFAEPDIDAELILLSQLLWERLNLEKTFSLRLNTLGSADDRKQYRSALVEYLNAHRQQIDANAQQRIETNPLRVLDSKDASTREVIENAPRIQDFLSEASYAHHEQVKEIISRAGVAFQEDEYLVRGLDYYTGTVFEWVNSNLAAQNTVCGGGRYDGLVEYLGGAATPAAGLAMGIERVALAMDEVSDTNLADIYVVVIGEQAVTPASEFALEIRRQFPALRVMTHCGGGSIKAQMRRADKSGARVALILGEQEIAKQIVTIKMLREKDKQEQVSKAQALSRIEQLI